MSRSSSPPRDAPGPRTFASNRGSLCNGEGLAVAQTEGREWAGESRRNPCRRSPHAAGSESGGGRHGRRARLHGRGAAGKPGHRAGRPRVAAHRRVREAVRTGDLLREGSVVASLVSAPVGHSPHSGPAHGRRPPRIPPTLPSHPGRVTRRQPGPPGDVPRADRRTCNPAAEYDARRARRDVRPEHSVRGHDVGRLPDAGGGGWRTSPPSMSPVALFRRRSCPLVVSVARLVGWAILLNGRPGSSFRKVERPREKLSTRTMYELTITPQGHLLRSRIPPDVPGPKPSTALLEAYRESPARGMLSPRARRWTRWAATAVRVRGSIARLYLTQPLHSRVAARRVASLRGRTAPGSELERGWPAGHGRADRVGVLCQSTSFGELVAGPRRPRAGEIANHPGGAQDYLRVRDPRWRLSRPLTSTLPRTSGTRTTRSRSWPRSPKA